MSPSGVSDGLHAGLHAGRERVVQPDTPLTAQHMDTQAAWFRITDLCAQAISASGLNF